MISRTRRFGSMPDSASVSFTPSTKSACWTSRADTFTLRNRSSGTAPSRCHAPVCRHASRRTQTDRQDRAVFLGDFDELPRRDRAARRVVPADQCLGAGHPGALELDDGLVDEAQSVELDGPLQVAGELVAIADGSMHAGIEDREGGLAIGLGHVHRHVGIAHEIVRAVDRVAGAGDADARA